MEGVEAAQERRRGRLFDRHRQLMRLAGVAEVGGPLQSQGVAGRLLRQHSPGPLLQGP
jgi:hypothetical protein